MAKTPTRITIEVNEADIERAHVSDSYNCVVSQAIARTVRSATNIETDTQSIRFTVDDERRIYMTPYAVQGYVIAFDAGDPIEPFSFQLRDPRRAKRKVRTTAGKEAQKASAAARRKATAKAATPARAEAQRILDRAAARLQQDAVVPPVQTTLAAASGTTDDPKAAAKAAYAAARAAHGNAPTTKPAEDGVTRKAPPRVFKRKRRAYGHRLLRINQD